MLLTLVTDAILTFKIAFSFPLHLRSISKFSSSSHDLISQDFMPQKMAFGLSSANSAMEVIKILDAKAVLAMALLRATIPI